VRADRTVIVFGAFLFMLGVAVAWNGYGYVNVERGWTLVISGTIAFCSGLILIALGLGLRELRAIAASADRATLLLVKARSSLVAEPEEAVLPPAPVVQEIAQGIAQQEELPPAPPATEVDAPAEAPPPPVKSSDWSSRLRMPRVNEASDALRVVGTRTSLSWMNRPADDRPVLAKAPEAPEPPESRETPQESLQERPQQAVLPSEPASHQDEAPHPPILPLVSTSDSLQQVALYDSEPLGTLADAPEASETLPPPLPQPEPHHDAAPAYAPPQDERFSEPLAERYAPPLAEPEPAQPFESEPKSESQRTPEAEIVPDAAQAPEPGADGEAAPGEPAEDELRPAVIGQYEAQGAHYTIYADGSIDAETAHGVYRFPSMEELKRFIENQQ
jgi:hypothetical protein